MPQNVSDPHEVITRIWSEVLDIPAERIAPSDNFFAIGGESLLIPEVMERVNRHFYQDRRAAALAITEFFVYTTVDALARRVTRSPAATPASGTEPHRETVKSEPIAIIGMAGRFPGAPTVDAFWESLCRGEELIRSFSEDELRGAGIGTDLLADPSYVKRGGLLDGVELFDAAYFGLTAREAALTCPQQRLLLECASEALEHAGHGARERGERVGVFVGAGRSVYLSDHVGTDPTLETPDDIAALVANSSPATRISYLLDLTGPSFTLDTACSSSLVALHQACVALRFGECDMALAGGASVRHFEPRGYRYQDGGLLSPDGHCRPFDSLAAGTVFASGVGLVLLRRLSDAQRDGDAIYAVIRGTAINNDGKEKAGYTAPSVSGQALAIKTALADARVDPATVTYVETHGTATPLGDPVEFAALRQAFGGRTARCALGALKSNVGHLESAAGVAGVIKTALALKHRTIPPTIHFGSPNPALQLGDGAFEVNTRLSEWTATGAPRRAGVSSFGIGGTNAHAVLEEAPDSAREETRRDFELLPISARTESALRSACSNLAARLERDDAPSLADAAYTLQVGRAAHEWRSFVVCSTVDEAVRALRVSEGHGRRVEPRARRVVLVFAGIGSAAEGIPPQLYREHSAFRESVARCAELASRNLQIDLLRNEFVASAPCSVEPAGLPAATPAGRNVALFVRQYAWACLLRAWGIEPAFLVGEGVGEYVAACLAGAVSLEDAMLLAHARGLDDAAELARAANAARPGQPRIPYMSSVTGRVVGAGFASADYWIRQREVETDFTALVRPLLDGAPKVLLAAGPDAAVSRRLRESLPGEKHLIACGGGRAPPGDGAQTLEALGALWSVGLEPDWVAFNCDRRARRTPLPTYPFERRHHWLDAKARAPRAAEAEPVSGSVPSPRAADTAASARSALEAALSQIWRDLFGVESVNVHDDFFALGGDSLLAVQLNTRTRSHFGRPLPLRELMMHPTISQIADFFSKG